MTSQIPIDDSVALDGDSENNGVTDDVTDETKKRKGMV